MILENKTLLGLAKAPARRAPIEPLNEEQLIEAALSERQQRAKDEKMDVVATDRAAQSPWSDYIVTSRLSGKSYRVALRGFERGDSYCTCPDYRDNTLGTCKHIMKALLTIRRRFDAAVLKKKPKLKEIIVFL